MYGEKRFAVLANRIVNIQPTNFFCCLNKILVLPTNPFAKLTKSFVKKTEILLGQQKKLVGCISTIRFVGTTNFFSSCVHVK